MTETSAKYNIQVAQIFCEDFRMEDSGKPMRIGLLSPVLYGDEPFTGQSIYSVTYLVVPSDLPKVELELRLTTTFSGERKTRSYKTDFEADETDLNGNWSVVAPLKFEIDLAPGDEPVEALLICNGQQYLSTLRVVRPATGESSSETDEFDRELPER